MQASSVWNRRAGVSPQRRGFQRIVLLPIRCPCCPSLQRSGILRCMLSLLLRRPAFRRLWAAGTVSLVGVWLSFVAISRLALDAGGGALALATVFAVHLVPRAWFMPLAGVVADRFDRRRL